MRSSCPRMPRRSRRSLPARRRPETGSSRRFSTISAPFTRPAASALFLGEQATPDWFLPQSPNLFWPGDHAWCVGSEVDFDSTLVAGSAALIDELISSDDLEVWRVNSDDFLTYDADQIN